MPADPPDLGLLVDHHCHGLVQRDLDRPGFEAMLNEASGPSQLGTSLFDSMLGLAVRRWCAPVLDLPEHASAGDYLGRRSELGAAEVNSRFVAAAGIEEFLVDTGLDVQPLCSPTDLASMCGGTAHEILRLESLGEEVLASGVPREDFGSLVGSRLRDTSAVGAKSIAAYRTGLRLPARQPTEDELVAALVKVQPSPSGAFRIADPVVNGWLAWAAIEAGLPLQFHVGYGDSDVDLLDCDPLQLTAFLRATAEREVPVLLLHNYPFHRNAAYLAQVFDHVFLDLGLTTHNTGALSSHVIRETLELAPFGKLLFSSDAYGLAELYYLGALLFRRGLGSVLGSLLDSGDLTTDDAIHLGELVARDNARRAYRLEAAAVAR
ncbi:MAG: amidohydrolase [Actinomycetota bacterium]|nr:amidohydrolase [Actinomycetota bacterium]